MSHWKSSIHCRKFIWSTETTALTEPWILFTVITHYKRELNLLVELFPVAFLFIFQKREKSRRVAYEAHLPWTCRVTGWRPFDLFNGNLHTKPRIWFTRACCWEVEFYEIITFMWRKAMESVKKTIAMYGANEQIFFLIRILMIVNKKILHFI